MNLIDIPIAFVLIVRAYFGSKQGLIKGALLLAAAIVGVTLAGNFYKPIATALGFITIQYVPEIIAFALILTIVEIAAAIPIRMLTFVSSKIVPGMINRAGGTVSGFLMGAVELSGLLAIVVKLIGVGLITESLLAGVLLDKAPFILSLLPGEFSIVRDFFR